MSATGHSDGICGGGGIDRLMAFPDIACVVCDEEDTCHCGIADPRVLIADSLVVACEGTREESDSSPGKVDANGYDHA